MSTVVLTGTGITCTVAPMAVLDNGALIRVIERMPRETSNVLVIATLDTKREDAAYLAALIERCGASALLLDSSVGGKPAIASWPTIPREAVAAAAGRSIEEITALPRGEAVAAMRAGVLAITCALADDGHIHGAVCLGGAGAHLAGPAFQALDLGFPKLIVSPLASGQRQFEPYIGLRDVAVMHSVADVAGVNRITSRVYRSAAGYIAGAARAYRDITIDDVADRPAIAVSMNGNTTPALNRARGRLEELGFGVVAFHANGVGGRALEEFVGSGQAAAVLDFTTTELGAELVGGLMDAGPTRMETAGAQGVPQVLVPGCADFITSGRWDETQQAFPGRSLFAHNPELTLVRLTHEEMAELGRVFARKAGQAKGPTTIVVPAHGFSVPDVEGGPFWDPAADRAFISALEEGLPASVRLCVVEAHINDDVFADRVVEELLEIAPAVPVAEVPVAVASAEIPMEDA